MVGGRWLVAAGGWWWLAVLVGWSLVVGGWSPLAVGGGFRLAVGGWWEFAVAVGPLERSVTPLVDKEKWFLKDPCLYRIQDRWYAT